MTGVIVGFWRKESARVARQGASVTWFDLDERAHLMTVMYGRQDDGTMVGSVEEAVEYAIQTAGTSSTYGFQGVGYTYFEDPAAGHVREATVTQLRQEAA